ncbi:MAG: GGDEF domain-containing protein [Arcobacteraceae bacterium]
MAHYLSKKNKQRFSIAYIVLFALFGFYIFNTYQNLQNSIKQSKIDTIISDYNLYEKVFEKRLKKDLLIDNPNYINTDELVDEYAKSTPLYINKKNKQDTKYNLTIKYFDKSKRHSIDIEEKIALLGKNAFVYTFNDNSVELFGKISNKGYVNIIKQFEQLFILKEILNSSILVISTIILINIFIFFYLLTLFDEHEEVKKKMHSQYEKLSLDAKSIAMVDTLTGAYTRIKFDEDLNNLLQLAFRFKEQTFCLMILDIDNFKSVNDTHGHDYGDIVLKEISSTIQQNLRKTNYFYRWGGEEFVILMPMNKLNKSIVYAEKLREKISQIYFKKIEQVTCSFGLVEFKSTDDEKTLLKRADELLYEAKKNGKNRVSY